MKRFTVQEVVEHSNRTCAGPLPDSALNRWLKRLTATENDVFFFKTYLRVLIFSGFWLYSLSAPFSYVRVIVYYLAYLFAASAAFSTLHASSHRCLLKKPLGWLDRAIFYLVSASLGYPPEYFAVVHVPNHHAYNNGDRDLGASLRYDRGRFLSYVANVAAFCGQRTGFIGLFALLRQRKGSLWLKRLVWGEVAFCLLVAGVAFVDWRKAIAFLVVPFFLMHWVDRTINWVEHLFIGPDDPQDSWTNALMILGAINRGIGNAGYHAIHHIRINLPESELPAFFERNVDRFLERSLVFYDTDHAVLLVNVWLGRWRYVLDHLIVLDTDRRTEEELIEELRRRLRPIVGELSPARESAPEQSLS